MSLFDFFSRSKKPVKLPFVTDIHCHIVPGVDDGSPDVEHSLDLIERMQAWGIERIVATPHVTEDTFENTPDILDPALDELKTALREAGNDIKIVRASENRIDNYFIELFEAGMIKPMPGNHLLVENSFIQEPMRIDQFLYDLKIKGFKPILAHPERYLYYHDRDHRRYSEMHSKHTYFQINLLSLAGAYGKEEKKWAERLIELGYVDFVGSDLHNRRHADIIDRYLTTSDARRHFAALQGHLLNDTLSV